MVLYVFLKIRTKYLQNLKAALGNLVPENNWLKLYGTAFKHFWKAFWGAVWWARGLVSRPSAEWRPRSLVCKNTGSVCEEMWAPTFLIGQVGLVAGAAIV